MFSGNLRIFAILCVIALLVSPVLAGVNQGPMQTQVRNLLEKVRSGGVTESSLLSTRSFVADIQPGMSGPQASLLAITYPYRPPVRNSTITYPFPGPAPTVYPLPVIPTIPTTTPIIPSSSRGFGSLLVKTSYEGQLYLWIKSDFFAQDVEPGYDMRWHTGGAIPVYYENNILAGHYYLKATTSSHDNSTGVLWCGQATIYEGQVTEVNIVPTVCPFGCSCC
ncbi:hypothetical protein J2741_001904 [Methanolinea mesophila]|uniref:hypothetical protein n=1 Tax=Methanolinea mesophila TaxID=547055 RepID=UPI001AE8AAA0|nr:hypothetical protein [Methanolinea mesophila]MBP1929357.1 hypothetical protein [Methanolinea mesophila]